MSDLPVGFISPDPDRVMVMRKLRMLADLIECGRVAPDFIQVAWAVGLLTEERELALARRYERIARRLMPSFEKNLT